MRGHTTVRSSTATAAAMKRSPNPMDPLDPFKRWFTELWPAEQLGVVLAIVLGIVLLVLWATR